MPIQVLDQNTINQIAAGEVIERPASVVKELTENAMDAGATAVTVEIREGGISLIRITDNGSGIEAGEVKTAFLPHATSKIRNAEDLVRISSLGFRGEALASIAAVARVELITRTRESLTGIRYRIEGGKEQEFQEIGAPEGTTFLVRDLFFNTPARQKFLKTPASEGAAISSMMERLALSRPDISFRLIVNGQVKLHTAGNHRLKDIIYQIYGREISQGLLPLEAETGEVRISGFVGKPEISRGNRTYENYFVNGRYVRSNLLTKALENAFRGFMMQQKFPFSAFHLEIPPELLDVNVHPAKLELRFQKEEEVYEAVYACVRGALEGKELIPRNAFTEKQTEEKRTEERGPEPFEIRRLQETAGIPGKERVPVPKTETPKREDVMVQTKSSAGPTAVPSFVRETPSYRKEVPLPLREEAPAPAFRERPAYEPSTIERIQKEAAAASAPKQMDLFEDRLFTPRTRDEYRIIGSLFDTYWLFQYKDNFLIMDQHAAHEKVLYERNAKLFRKKEFTSQQVQPPILLTLNARELQAVEEKKELFTRYGFEIEPFGGREVAVAAIPGNLLGLAEQELLKELIDAMADEDSHTESTVISDKLALMSCRAAVKGGDRLSREEVEALLDELLQLENPYMCPHGRPTIITMTRTELEKKFKRIVS